MQTCDFTRSFFHFETDHEAPSPLTITVQQPITRNQVRIPVECRCEVTNPQTGTTTQYVLGASCKTEKVNVDRDVWLVPNADFCVVSSEETFLIIKRFERLDVEVPTEANMAKPICRQVGKSDGAWTRHSRNLHMVTGRQLELPDEVITATLADRPLNARTEFVLADGHQVMIEYPVKTINVSERDRYYQVDTGPVLLPDLSIGHESFVGNFRLAYIAHNCTDWAELVVNVPTPVAKGISVDHYSQPVRLETRNSMIEPE
ncbi:MAG: hypothetical protein MK179_20665 [Pirellulaceae bacterium]|nr:hypothetical protein [Pirellulaceae bacterium]